MSSRKLQRSRGTTKLGGRPAISGVIKGRYSLSVGKPSGPTPPGWEWVALTDVARLETGHTPSRKHPEYWGGSVPWIGIKDAVPNHGRTIDDTIDCSTEAGIANSSARVLPRHTVCLSRTASVGYVVVMGEPMATSQDFVNWSCSESLNHHFLKYVLLAEGRPSLLRFASGTTHQTIYLPEVKAFHICLPSRSTQSRIAAVLGAYDDLIEVNRRRIQVLEEMAQTIYREWFVNFRYPGHEKDELVETASGEVPENWQIAPVGSVVQLMGGGTPSRKKTDYWESATIDWYTPSDLTASRTMFMNGSSQRINELGLANSSAKIFPAGSVMMTSRATIGVVSIATGPSCTNQGFITLLPSKSVGRYQQYFWLRDNVEKFISVASGATFKEISKRTFREIPIAVPPTDISRAFHQTVDPIASLVRVLESKSQLLAKTRDLLLPRLVSGELDVSDLDIAGEEVAV